MAEPKPEAWNSNWDAGMAGEAYAVVSQRHEGSRGPRVRRSGQHSNVDSNK